MTACMNIFNFVMGESSPQTPQPLGPREREKEREREREREREVASKI